MLLSKATEEPDALGMFAQASARLRRVVPFDAAVWRATDPETGILTTPMHGENIDAQGCFEYWETELLAGTVNLYSDLTTAPVPVAGLRDTTGDCPGTSAIYVDFMKPRGLYDELRAVLRVGSRPQGTISLFRTSKAFSRADVEFVNSLVTPLARRLRSYATPAEYAIAAGGPGLLLFDAAGSLVSVNDEARRYLEELPEGGPSTDSRLDLPVPPWLHTIALTARSGPAWIRLRTRGGRWLVCHASPMDEIGGGPQGSAVVLEPAKASDVMPLVADAYELSEREVEVTQHVARGLPTEKIAEHLFLSPHTVRDHIKAIFEKTQVSSRGELVGKLFVEHYRPAGEQTVQAADERRATAGSLS
ncbi:regulatory LuxR family protein [Kribbella orskensis]|uniref:Regulatory LuxR family protein n=1 Tax=Kribbella orskensis TaxID=2512216 RepID=A0ABY2BCC7_9ACTN|nr:MULTISPECIES: helix-turn-helix transcriptional regulator [Kribbella]TCN32842.1 regulatory LuxR family protein [Kribbella sp. VKM Ac-2500]TCO13284.1 regulatory LuxR family protein [Kribbella orskensis]